MYTIVQCYSGCCCCLLHHHHHHHNHPIKREYLLVALCAALVSKLPESSHIHIASRRKQQLNFTQHSSIVECVLLSLLHTIALQNIACAVSVQFSLCRRAGEHAFFFHTYMYLSRARCILPANTNSRILLIWIFISRYC